MARFDSPRLLADIGSNFVRFMLELQPGEFARAYSRPTAECRDFASAVEAYLRQLDGTDAQEILHAGVAVAGSVEGDLVRMVNLPWQFSIEELRQRLRLDTLLVINDFTALAMALPRLTETDVRQVGGGLARRPAVIGLLGAGGGLGVSGLIPTGESWVALGTEGGHAAFAPRDEREVELLRYAWQQHDHVSFERLLSGPGLELIHEACCARHGLPITPRSAPQISQRALQEADPVCLESLDVFCSVLGTAASNLAVSLGALGGIYIGGSVVPGLGEFFDRSNFRTRFEDKGRLSDYVKAIPTFVIQEAQSTFKGIAAALDGQLKAHRQPVGSAILGQIRRARSSLTPAELRVAEHVLAHPRTVLADPIAEIARAANVSQPTVIRFCRSLGCEGLSDFKLRLASGLTAAIPVTHAQISHEDSVLELGAKVLSNTASAILQVRNQLSREMTERAIDALQQARRVSIFASGHYCVVAKDAEYKFLRLGITCGAYVEPRLQQLAAELLGPGDVAILTSGGGRAPELLNVLDLAQARGAKVIAITAGQSPLAKRADAALVVDHLEDTTTHLPMVSRVLHLLMVDVLALGLAMRGHAPLAAEDGTTPVTTVSLAALTAHSR
ncbi:glucokinase [Roseateles sp.]|uniref:glucokinase n=1 Tax=Roseateles sp. TaxID=1971397 RepID=UPI003955BC05